MAIKYLAGNVLEGLSTDTKPTTVPAQSRFRETDTLVDWKFDGTDWFEMTGCFNPNVAETISNKTLSGLKMVDAAKTANYTLLTTDAVIRVDASAGAVTLTLPAASGNAGVTYTIIRTDIAASTNKLIIDGNASETVDGNLNYLLWTGQSIVIECDGSNWVALARPNSSHIGTYFRRGATDNRRYAAGVVDTTATIVSTTGPTVDTLYAMPFIVGRTTKFDTIECEVTTLGSGSNIRLGIYRDDGNCYPGSLLFDSGNLSAASTGAKSATITAGVQTFQPGLYWLTYENSATVPQVRALAGAGAALPILGLASPFSTTLAGQGWTVAHTVGALPDPYTAGGTIRTTASLVGNPIPVVALRAV